MTPACTSQPGAGLELDLAWVDGLPEPQHDRHPGPKAPKPARTAQAGRQPVRAPPCRDGPRPHRSTPPGSPACCHRAAPPATASRAGSGPAPAASGHRADRGAAAPSPLQGAGGRREIHRRHLLAAEHLPADLHRDPPEVLPQQSGPVPDQQLSGRLRRKPALRPRAHRRGTIFEAGSVSGHPCTGATIPPFPRTIMARMASKMLAPHPPAHPACRRKKTTAPAPARAAGQVARVRQARRWVSARRWRTSLRFWPG
jgi:hypothetical protein